MSRPRTHLATLLSLTLAAAGALGIGAFLATSSAAAQATVRVEVRAADGSPGDARVTLTPSSGGAAHSCQTRAGRCEIAAVSAGRYVVSAAPANGGQSPIPRPVLIGGRAPTVHVTLR